MLQATLQASRAHRIALPRNVLQPGNCQLPQLGVGPVGRAKNFVAAIVVEHKVGIGAGRLTLDMNWSKFRTGKVHLGAVQGRHLLITGGAGRHALRAVLLFRSACYLQSAADEQAASTSQHSAAVLFVPVRLTGTVTGSAVSQAKCAVQRPC